MLHRRNQALSLAIFCKMFAKLWGLFWRISLFVIVLLDYAVAEDEKQIVRGPGGEWFFSSIICCNKVRSDCEYSGCE